MPNEKIEEIGEIIRKEFVLAGEQVKTQILNDFEKLLEGDLKAVKKVLEEIIKSQNKKLADDSIKNMRSQMGAGFEGSVFGDIIAQEAMASVFNQSNSATRSNEFRSATSQSFLEIGKAIAKYQSRNS